MPATPGAPRRGARRDQRRDQRREWSALETPHGFERCVRATLRELYGYVALLSGRDRAEAERMVGDVYRSLFRAARAGHVESVTLGALRSAARRTWLDEHRVELTETDEVSRAPVSTISELSPLERAVLVFQHVNGMSPAQAASEVGRTEREVAAVGAHAVRRLRGTDDTSGAWLRAYLGPTVTPAARLVDRIVLHLGEPDEPAVDADGSGSGEPPGPPVDGAAPVAPRAPAPDVDEPDGAATTDLPTIERPTVEPPTTEPPTTEPPTIERPTVEVPTTEPPTIERPTVEVPTTELPSIERPTVEVPTIVSADPAAPPAVEHVHGEPMIVPEPIEPTDPPGGRPRWALAIGVVLVAALVVALVWLVLRGDADATVVSTPATASAADESDIDSDAGPDPDPDPDTDTAAGPDTDTADTADTDIAAGRDTDTGADDPGDAAPDVIEPTTTADPRASVAGAVAVGFDPMCTERTGTEPAASPWGDSFGPLATEPALQVTLPESVDLTADVPRQPSRPTTVLRSDSVVVAVSPAAGHRQTQTIVARIGLDGTIAWIRCLDGEVRIGSAPDSGVELALRSTAEDATWSALSIDSGSIGDPLDAVQAAVLDAPAHPDRATASDDAGPTLGYSYASDLGRSVLAGIEDGRVLWTAPEVVLPRGDAFRAVAVQDTVVAQSCATDVCTTGELRGHDRATGEQLWSRPGVHALAAAADGLALVGDGEVWELLDVRTGVAVEGQRWEDADVFAVGDDLGLGSVVRNGGALVVSRPGAVSVWLPADIATESAATAIR